MAEVSYRQAHRRVERVRGKAREHLCIACSQQAAHWCYRYGSDGDAPYSDDPDDYEPRCAKCHMRLDREALLGRRNGGGKANAAKTQCKWGHPFSAANTRVDTRGRRVCLTCQRRITVSRRLSRRVEKDELRRELDRDDDR